MMTYFLALVLALTELVLLDLLKNMIKVSCLIPQLINLQKLVLTFGMEMQSIVIQSRQIYQYLIVVF